MKDMICEREYSNIIFKISECKFVVCHLNFKKSIN